MNRRYFIVFSQLNNYTRVESLVSTDTGKIFTRKEVVTNIADEYNILTSDVSILGWQEFSNEEDFKTYSGM